MLKIKKKDKKQAVDLEWLINTCTECDLNIFNSETANFVFI